MADALALALEYAERFAWPVLPLDGKAPLGRLVPHGVKDAKTDAATIRRWWATEPEANVGIACGGGLAVLDIDPRNGGDESLAELLDIHAGELPTTPAVATGGGGSHHYFHAPATLRGAELAPGVDLKAGGGYVAAPPSIHPDTGRAYVWHPYPPGSTPLADLPAWILEAAGQNGGHRAARPASEWAALVRNGARRGERNIATARLAGYLLRIEQLDPRVAAELVAAWNAARNHPPLPAREVEQVVDSIARREARKARKLAGGVA